MTAPDDPDGDLIGLAVSGGIAHFPNREAEQVRMLADLDAACVAELLKAADAALFFSRPEPSGSVPLRPDARTYKLRLRQAGRARLLVVREPFETPELARLVGIARRCLTSGSGRSRWSALSKDTPDGP